MHRYTDQVNCLNQSNKITRVPYNLTQNGNVSMVMVIIMINKST